MQTPSAQAIRSVLGCAPETRIENLERLSGGANMETWSFDALDAGHRRALILRRRPGDATREEGVQALLKTPSLATEATLIELARRAGVPVPTVLGLSPSAGELGEALIMNRIPGESLPQRILHRPEYASAREKLAFQCGEALGKLHSIALDDCPPGLRDVTWSEDLARLQGLCDHFSNPSPSHQLALNWLKAQPAPASARVLCHGDYRLGNLLVGKDGLRSVLDWELAHIGFAGEDLGYLCANVWRFSGEAAVGGFGTYRQLLDGYRSVGGAAPDLAEIKLWELYAALGWGLVCLTMLEMHLDGVDPSLERAAVGRRLSESEIDILLLLDELNA